MRRREFITLLGGAAAAWPSAAHAQVAPKRQTIAWLSAGAPQLNAPFIESFLRGMKELGYVEGRDFDMVYRYTEGYQERLPALTEEVIGLKPDVILAPAVIGAVAAKKLTSKIPIVSPALADAVHLGLISSEARPGGNVTGIEPYVAGLPAKQIEFAREIVPARRGFRGFLELGARSPVRRSRPALHYRARATRHPGSALCASRVLLPARSC